MLVTRRKQDISFAFLAHLYKCTGRAIALLLALELGVGTAWAFGAAVLAAALIEQNVKVFTFKFFRVKASADRPVVLYADSLVQHWQFCETVI